jgi:anti-sigma regulatory factor (Ser/Thr protein kinase)
MSAYTAPFPGTLDSVGRARRWTAAMLRATPNTDVPAEVIETAELLVSEVATNAVRHTLSGAPGGVYGISLHVGRGLLRADVTNRAALPGTRIAARPATFHREGGRGLILVDALAHAWGVLPTGNGVHFTLRWDAPPGPMPPLAPMVEPAPDSLAARRLRLLS